MNTKLKITIKKDDNLREVAEQIGLSQEDAAEKIILRSRELGVITNDLDYAGMFLINHYKENGFPEELAVFYCLSVYTQEIEKPFKKLMVWGIVDECPECGSPLDYDLNDTYWDQVAEDSSPYRKGIAYVKCVNCNYEMQDKAENIKELL